MSADSYVEGVRASGDLYWKDEGGRIKATYLLSIEKYSSWESRQAQYATQPVCSACRVPLSPTTTKYCGYCGQLF